MKENPEDRQPDDDLFQELERRALHDMPEEDGEELDILRVLEPGDPDAPAADLTLGGYIDLHDRVPAFEGIDGQPYTVDVEVETGDLEDGYVAFFIFVRWAATGAGIMDHVESGDVARGRSEAEARAAAMELSLYEVKAELDRSIERRRAALEE
jgi:hypothetical protein